MDEAKLYLLGDLCVLGGQEVVVRTSVRDVFAVAAAAYDRGNPLLAIERPETEALLPCLGGQDVLDLGAGRGHYAALARALGARLTVALDLTPEMVKGAPRPIVVGDAARIPLRDASVDVVVAGLLVSYVSDRAGAFAEIARVLRPGGVLVLSDLHPVASERGWSRTFVGPSGERLLAPVAPPSIEELRRRLGTAGLCVEVVREPAIDGRLEDDFRRAGRRDFDRLRGTPLLVVLRARKEASAGA